MLYGEGTAEFEREHSGLKCSAPKGKIMVTINDESWRYLLSFHTRRDIPRRSCSSQATKKLMRELWYESHCAYPQQLHLFPLVHHWTRVPLWNVLTIDCWYSEQSKAFSKVTTKTATHMAAYTHFAICIRKLLISHSWSLLRWELMLTSDFGS